MTTIMTTRGGPGGYRGVEFRDAKGAECRLWEATGATEPTCPLAPDLILWPEGRYAILDRLTARWLAARLLEFAETGRLPEAVVEPTP